MGLFKAWKEAKAVLTTAAPSSPARAGHHDMAAGLVTIMGKMMAPTLAAQAPARGNPLPGSEAGVLEAQEPGAVEAAAAAVQARDSAFDPQLLTTFADQVFAAYCSAWGTGDVSAMRQLLADAIWEPISASLGSGIGTGIGIMASLMHGRAALTGLWAGASYDTARMSFAVTVDLPQGSGEAPPGFADRWTEDWLFQRSVEPGGNPMMTAETCPSCGAPTGADTGGLCTHCHQPIPVRTAGWLVTCIRSHNPMADVLLAQVVGQLRQNPMELQMMPDEVVRLLPADAVAAIDPQRATALGLRPSP